MDDKDIKYFLEAALLAAGRPLNIDQLQGLFDGRMEPEKAVVSKTISTLDNAYAVQCFVISEGGSAFRM